MKLMHLIVCLYDTDIVTSGSSFEAVVNSIIAISAGAGMGQQRGRSQLERQFTFKDTMNRVMALLKKAI
jgi:hypothetical protein